MQPNIIDTVLYLHCSMKKAWVTILLLIYFTVSSGFVVNLHYCMGDFAGVELGAPNDKECGKCGMAVQKKAGCCHDEVKVVKVAQEQPAATFAQFHFGVAKALPVHAQNPYLALKPIAQHRFAPAHGPPLSGPDIYLSNCVFRI
jgi:hypothetical protein